MVVPEELAMKIPKSGQDKEQLFEALPAEVTEMLLSTFINELFVSPKD
jgi:hypothetical protein